MATAFRTRNDGMFFLFYHIFYHHKNFNTFKNMLTAQMSQKKSFPLSFKNCETFHLHHSKKFYVAFQKFKKKKY
jgi:hypothetical protein